MDMDMSTSADIDKAKDLRDAIVAATVGSDCLTEVVKTGQGPTVRMHSRFIDRRFIASMAEAAVFVAESSAARAAGVVAAEVRITGDGPPAWLTVRAPAKIPARFAHVLPKGHPMRP